MKKQGFTLVELLAVIAILAILIIIALPNILKMFNDAQMKLFLQEARNINKAAEDSYLAHKMGASNLTETTYTYTDGEETVTGNISMKLTGQKPQNGELIIRPNGDTALAFHNGKYCARKSFDSDEITISRVTEDQCVLDNLPVVATSELCFEFDDSTGTILNYYDYEEDNSSNPVCPSEVVIPSEIDGVPVVAIGDYALAYYNYAVYNYDESKDLELLNNNVTDKNNIYKLSSAVSTDTYNPVNISDNRVALRYEPLVSLIIPNTVEYIGECAFIANNIESIEIPSSVNTIGAAAFERNNITTVTIGNGVTTIGENAFSRNNITVLEIPDSVTNIEDKAFAYNGLTNITIGRGLISIGESVFYYNETLTNLVVDSDNPNYMSSNNALYTKDGQTLLLGAKTCSNNILNTTKTIETNAFEGMGLTSLTIPDGVITIKRAAFHGNELTSVTIPNSVTTIEAYGFGYNKLTSVMIGTGITSLGERSFNNNRITQGNFKIDKVSGSVSFGSNVLGSNGSLGNTTITPTYLR
jgi:prepilin-type N-terminal cleavage/methylation domain-containing protein